jgi:hypothetical protein
MPVAVSASDEYDPALPPLALGVEVVFVDMDAWEMTRWGGVVANMRRTRVRIIDRCVHLDTKYRIICSSVQTLLYLY